MFHSIKMSGFISIIKPIIFVVLGIGFCLYLFTWLILSFPLLIYRLILIKIIAPCLRPKIGMEVTTNGHAIAAEFLAKSSRTATRSGVVISIVFRGTVSVEEAMETLNTRWIHKIRNDSQSALQYPEFQYYIENWMGFMFWKKDNNFDIKNHIQAHKLEEGGNAEDSEKFFCALMEELVNKPFPPKRSPWEIHFIHNYKNNELQLEPFEEDEKMTAVIFRFHHALADGFSILSAIIEGLLGVPLASVQTVVPPQESENSFTSKCLPDKLTDLIKLPFKLFYDGGYFVWICLRRKSPWHIEDVDKTWRQIYGRSPLIPIAKIKSIKNRLGVSFTSVLMTCLAGGISKMLQRKKQEVENVCVWIPLPMPGHPRELRNNTTGTLFDLPISSTLTPLQRLNECEARLEHAKQSLLPLFGVFALNLLGAQLAPLARLALKNRMFSTGLSNLPGPGVEIIWNGKNVMATDFAGGVLEGVAGVGFMLLSYCDHVRIAVVAENAVLKRNELEILIGFVCEEIDILSSITTTTYCAENNC